MVLFRDYKVYTLSVIIFKISSAVFATYIIQVALPSLGIKFQHLDLLLGR